MSPRKPQRQDLRQRGSRVLLTGAHGKGELSKPVGGGGRSGKGATAVEGVFQELSRLAGRDVEGLSLAAPAGRSVQDVHALAAGADHVGDEAGTVAADVLEHGAVRVDDGELLLHAAPARALQGAGRTRRTGLVRNAPGPTRAEAAPGHRGAAQGRVGRSGTYRKASLLWYGGPLAPREPGKVSKPKAKTGMWPSFFEGIFI